MLNLSEKLNSIKLNNNNVALLHGQVYSSKKNKFENKNLFLTDGKVVSADVFEKATYKTGKAEFIDLENNYVTPAIIDQHIHGGFGVDFNKANEEEIRKFLTETKKYGYGAILATFIPASPAILNKQMDIVRKIMKEPHEEETIIEGIHLEGPFINPQKKGIHLEENLMVPTLDTIKKINLDGVKIVTIAPELDKNYEVTKYLNDKGIITSAGHSVATAEQVKNSGVKQVTHLFNAMSPFHHRIPTIANEGLLNDNLYAEVISTPEHLAPSTVDLITTVKPQDKIILISDALSATNVQEKSFFLNDKEIFINKDHTAKDKNGTIAGSIRLISQTAKNLINTTKMTFANFIKYATQNPAKNLGIEDSYKIENGKKPNITVWNKNTLEPISTFITYA